MDKASLSEFERAPFSAVFADKSRGVRKIKQSDYLQDGYHPIIDQGQSEIAGYCNEEEGLFRDVPAIVFGDHTRCVKYAQEPFFAGADGVKILKPKLSDNVRFWYHALKATRIEDLGYSRHFKLLKQSSFRIYDCDRENEITERLDCIQGQIEMAKRQAEWLNTLLKSRFVEMFGDPIGNPKYIQEAIGALATVRSGATPSRKKPEYYDGDIPWVKTGEVAVGNINQTEEHITLEAIENSACHLLPAGTVLVAMYGQGDTRGKAALLNIEAATNQACAALEFDERVNNIFALTQLHLCYDDLRLLSHGGNQKNLNLQIIKSYKLMVPPIELQNEFAAFAAQVDKSKSIAQKRIDKLHLLYDSLAQEYFGD